ncbi:hypothetical protein BN988_02849 [Oceanobacillus picturae]|uniref:Uncharacterized protein n=1 Tax=Oceanobacillus picturae TaxID=171693 RepID=W9BDB8_9BACI|nr:hypothetical protein [Oceanobacillus picturae]CDO04295.1 hypothetical protein BN988_02849 [Oceanobacillus picturae]
MVDYNNYCSVLFFFENEEGKGIIMNYERSQSVDDNTLTEEAKNNAKDMIKKKLNGANELVAIAIARSEMQHKDIMNKAKNGFR